MNDEADSLIDDASLKILKQRSDYKGLVQLSAHLGLLLLVAVAIYPLRDSFWALPLLLVYGTLLTFLFAPLHECIHYTAFASRKLNDMVAAFCGFVLLIPFRYFRAFHYGHHRHTQNPQLDPELVDRKPMTRARYWLVLSGLPFWWENIRTIFQHAQGSVSASFIETRKHRVIVNEARWHLAGYAVLFLLSLLFSSLALWWYWLLPALLCQPLLRLFLFAEHGGCDFSDNMLENSRTTYSSPLINFLAWNMPYHAEHHYLASVPFHALPALHAFTGQKVKFRGAGYYRVNRELAAQL